MTDPRLIAGGRDADVFELADGCVLRRYRDGRDASVEARLLGWLDERGYPVPALRSWTGCDVVMDRIDGPTMFDVVRETPDRVDEMARLLVGLQRRLHQLDAPAWLPARSGVPEGRELLHLDLHPMNVLMSAAGPVVIDWTNASAGPAEFDAATTIVTMATAQLSDAVDIAVQRDFVASFEQHCGSIEHSWIQRAAALRMTDPNTTENERKHLARIRRAQINDRQEVVATDDTDC